MSWDHYAESYPQLHHLVEGLPSLLRTVLQDSAGSFLDVGCGEGLLLDQVRQEQPSWDIAGFEVSRVRGDIAARRGHTVLVGAENTVPAEPASFDVVASCHVIEHVPDDLAFARQLADLVKPGGHVYLETPVKLDGAWYFRRNPKAGWVLDPTHVREYRSAEAALTPLRAAGLEIVKYELTPIQYALASAERLVRAALRLPAATASSTSGWRAAHISIPRYRVINVLAQRPKES